MVDLTKLEKSAASKIEELFSQFDRHDCEISYEIGRVVVDAVNKAKKSQEHYGRDIVANIAASLDRPKSALERCRRIAEAFPHKATFNWFLQLSNGKYRLRVTHLAHLSRITDMEARKAMAKRAVEEKLSTSKLLSIIEAEYPSEDNKRRPKAGRPPRRFVPSTPSECLNHMIKQLEQLESRMEQDWFGEEFDLIEELDQIAPDEITQELLDAVYTAIQDLRSWSGAAYTKASDLEEAYTRVSKKYQLFDSEQEDLVPVK